MTSARRVLVTGANRGLGLELTRQFVAAGDQVWAACRTPESAHELQGLGAKSVLALDLASEASIHAAAAEVAANVDGLDVLVSCAGTDARAFGADDGERGPFDLGADVFTDVLRVNVTGPMVVTSAFLPLLRAAANAEGADGSARPAKLVNISSQLGSMEVAASIGRDTAYCVSKAGLNMYTVKSATELAGDNVAVVAVHPGWLRTDMGGEHADMSPEEASEAIVSTITGLTMADSGRFMRWDGTDHPW